LVRAIQDADRDIAKAIRKRRTDKRFRAALEVGFVARIVEKFTTVPRSLSPRLGPDDLRQEAHRVVWQACRKIDPEAERRRFARYLRVALKNRKRDLIEQHRAAKRDARRDVRLDDAGVYGLANVERELSSDVERLVGDREFERRMVERVFGTGSDTLLRVLFSVLGDLRWDGSRATYYRGVQRLIALGRELAGVDPAPAQAT